MIHHDLLLSSSYFQVVELLLLVTSLTNFVELTGQPRLSIRFQGLHRVASACNGV